MTFGRCVGVAIAAVIVAGVGGCTSEKPRGDVVVITVDTLRADHLSLYGYERQTSPQLDSWFGGGAIFERAYATEANTSPSVVSILSGRLPTDHRVRLLFQLVPDELALLPDLLPEAYQSAAFVANVVLTDEAMGMARRFDHYDDRVDEQTAGGWGPAYERNARRTTDAALEWLRHELDSDRPVFLWIHYIDPHSPYRAPADRPSSFEHDISEMVSAERVPGLGKGDWKGKQVDGLNAVDDYDEEIAFADAEIGRLLEGYAALRSIDDALLLFTADHAESMMEHEKWFSHGYQVYEEIIRVPLMLRGPGVEAGRYAALASGIDVAPTVLRFAGIEPPQELQGFDLRSPGAIAPDRIVLAEATAVSSFFGHWRTALQGNLKWVTLMRRGEREVLERRFYRLATDPSELEPLDWLSDAETQRLLLEISRTDPDPGGLPENAKAGIRIRAPKVSPRVGAEQLEKLRALGYVE